MDPFQLVPCLAVVQAVLGPSVTEVELQGCPRWGLCPMLSVLEIWASAVLSEGTCWSHAGPSAAIDAMESGTLKISPKSETARAVGKAFNFSPRLSGIVASGPIYGLQTRGMVSRLFSAEPGRAPVCL